MSYRLQNEIPMGQIPAAPEKACRLSDPAYAQKYILSNNGKICNAGLLQIIYIISGNGKFSVDDDEYSIKNGMLIFLNAGMVFSYKQLSPSIIYSCSFLPSVFGGSNTPHCSLSDLSESTILSCYFENPNVPFPVCRIRQSSFNVFRELFQKMILLSEGSSPVFDKLMQLYIAELLTRLSEQYMTDDTLDENIAGSIDDMQAVLSYIRNNYALKLTYDNLAKMALISRSKLYKMFADKTGQTIGEYIKGVRISQACILLAETKKSIYDIMLDVGYNDMKIFCRYFRQRMDMTPSEYRRLYKKN